MKERITNGKGKPKKKPTQRRGNQNVDTNQRTSGNDSSDRNYGDVNDANYYFLDDTVKSQITNVSFNQYVGVPFNISQTADGSKIAVEAPSIMALHLGPAAGTGNNTGTITGLDLAALNTYTKLSANNAKTTQYAPQDITMLYLALGQLIAMTSHIARIFGATRMYNVRNRAYPKRVITALGVNYDDLVANFADYKTYYNSLMTVLSSIPIPNNVPYFMKCSEIYSYLYLDMEGSSMAQTYAFIPYSTWKIDEDSESSGTKLTTVFVHRVGGNAVAMGTLLTTLNDMIQALLQSSTLNYIYSDLLRLADKEGLQLLKFSTLPDDYVVMPVYNPEIRKWINNATIIAAPLAEVAGHTPNNDVLSDPNMNAIKYNPAFKVQYGGEIFPIMNFDTGFPSIDDIVDATRLMANITADASGNSLAIALPDYYVVGCKIFESNVTTVLQFSVVSSTANNFAQIVSALSNFDWAPFIYVKDANGVVSSYIGDVNYFTTLDQGYLERLFDMGYQALLSMR